MSAIESPPARSISRPLSRPLRNILITLLLTSGTLALVGYFWRDAGYEMLIVTMGWPHVLLGFVFYFGRVWHGEPGSRPSFVMLGVLTLVLWMVHYNYAITGLIYLYFLFHLFRDEIFVYQQTRAGHRPTQSVYAIAGVGPLVILLLLVPKQQDFRQDMRRVEFTGSQISRNGWTLVPFKSVSNSGGREFYFYVQAPHTLDLRAFVSSASDQNVRDDGLMLVGDHPWSSASDLVFLPHYGEDPPAATLEQANANGNVPVLLTGGHRLGQTFIAEKDNLSGVWLPIKRLDDSGETTRFLFHLASPPLLPYSGSQNIVRDFLIVILTGIVLWRLIVRSNHRTQLWVYLAVLGGSFALTQTILKRGGNAGYTFPLIFQFAVVFHYWSWYVFSFDRLRSFTALAQNTAPRSLFDKMLGYLRRIRSFTIAVIVLNALSAIGVLCYYRFGGPAVLRYGFDYNYFLYVLVFHVTFSFRPQLLVERVTELLTPLRLRKSHN